MKKLICLLLALSVAAFPLAGCKRQTEEEKKAEAYGKLAESALALVQVYNDAAQKAKDNGWEADFATLKLMDEIAGKAEAISAAVEAPENMERSRLEELLAQSQALASQITEEVLPYVSEPCPAPSGQ